MGRTVEKQSDGRAVSRIQARNRQAILDAALEVFSAQGFRGATVDQIAEVAGLSKPNLLYYFFLLGDVDKLITRRSRGANTPRQGRE